MAMTSDRLDVVRPAHSVSGSKQGHWTYSHYAALPDDGPSYEIVDGVLYMAPAPHIDHQNTVLRIAHYLLMYAEFAGLGKVSIAPVDVVLAPNVVVQPDVLVLLKSHLDYINEGRIFGPPDLVVEVASPGTATYDRREKFDAYALADVPEYWIADVASHTIEIFALENGKYQTLGVFKGKATLPSTIVPEIAAVYVEQFFV